MFEVTVKYEKTQDNGLVKKVSEKYISQNAITFGDAEEHITREMMSYISGNFEVSAVKKVAYQDVIKNSSVTADKWYAVAINTLALDEKTGRLKKQPMKFLVQAQSVGDAKERFVKYTKDWMVDYEIESIADTKIMDVYEG